MSRRLTAGIDLGASKLELALVEASGHIVAHERRTTGADKPPERVIADIAALLGADALARFRDRIGALAPVHRMGVTELPRSGPMAELLDRCGISRHAIEQAALRLAA